MVGIVGCANRQIKGPAGSWQFAYTQNMLIRRGGHFSPIVSSSRASSCDLSSSLGRTYSTSRSAAGIRCIAFAVSAPALLAVDTNMAVVAWLTPAY